MIQILISTVSRFCISAVFLAGAIKNILNWHETEKSIMSVFADWQSHVGFSQEAQFLFSFFITWSSVLLLIATVFMLAGGLLLLLGAREKLATYLLIAFLIPATLLYHPFWWVDGVEREVQAVMFLKNLAIFGALLQMAVKREEREEMIRMDRFE